MKIHINQPVHPVDRFTAAAFGYLYNALVVSRDMTELSVMLFSPGVVFGRRTLSDYFKWDFTADGFVLYQRIAPGAEQYFKGTILTVSKQELQFKWRPETIH